MKQSASEIKLSKTMTITSQMSIMGFPDVFVIKTDDDKEQGRIIQTTNFIVKFFHIVVSNTWLPYSYKIVDGKKNVLGYIEKKWQPWTDRISILDEERNEIGFLRPNIGYTKSNYEVFLPQGGLIATVVGNSKSGLYTISTKKGHAPGTIQVEKQNVFIKTFFPQTRYKLTLPEVSGAEKEKRAIILSTLLLPILTTEVNN